MKKGDFGDQMDLRNRIAKEKYETMLQQLEEEAKKYECPTCHTRMNVCGSIQISPNQTNDPSLIGNYCLYCYSNFLAKNLASSKFEKKEEAQPVLETTLVNSNTKPEEKTV